MEAKGSEGGEDALIVGNDCAADTRTDLDFPTHKRERKEREKNINTTSTASGRESSRFFAPLETELKAGLRKYQNYKG